MLSGREWCNSYISTLRIDPTYDSEATATSSGHERPLEMMNDQPDGVSGTDQDLITKVSII